MRREDSMTASLPSAPHPGLVADTSSLVDAAAASDGSGTERGQIRIANLVGSSPATVESVYRGRHCFHRVFAADLERWLRDETRRVVADMGGGDTEAGIAALAAASGIASELIATFHQGTAFWGLGYGAAFAPYIGAWE